MPRLPDLTPPEPPGDDPVADAAARAWAREWLRTATEEVISDTELALADSRPPLVGARRARWAALRRDAIALADEVARAKNGPPRHRRET